MPELPEVETVRRDLERALRNDRATRIDVLDRRLLSAADEALWKKTVPGQAWTRFIRRGKYLWVELSNGWRLEFHLRMTGQLLLNPGEGAPKARLRVEFASGSRLAFCDPRRFGEAWLLPPGIQSHSKHPLGPDALLELLPEQLEQLVRHSPTRIHPLLLDQKRVAGVGNIYAQEALYKAGIRPTRAARRISKREVQRLYTALRDTLLTAIEHRGSTSRNYRDAYGNAGSAQTLHAVYRKGGLPCPGCEAPLKSARVGGRGAVYCALCQK